MWKHVGLFPLDVGEIRDVAVDFSQIIAMSPPEHAATRLLENRRFSLPDDDRDLFRTKLAASVGRPPSDEE